MEQLILGDVYDSLKPKGMLDAISLMLSPEQKAWQPFALTGDFMYKHAHVAGLSGSGKTKYLEGLIRQLIDKRKRVILLDPHGGISESLLKHLIERNYFRAPGAFEKLLYIKPADWKKRGAIAFNVLNNPRPEFTYRETAALFLEALHRGFPSSSPSTPAMDNALMNLTDALSQNGLTVVDMARVLLDKNLLADIAKTISDPLTRLFLEQKLESATTTDSVLRRAMLLASTEPLKYSLGQKANRLQFTKLLNEGTGTSLIFDLSDLDPFSRKMWGCLLMTQLETAFYKRASIPEKDRVYTWVFVDEFQNFVQQSEDAFSTALEELRKFHCTLVLCHQVASQLPTGIAGSLQNAIQVFFQMGHSDAQKYAPAFTKHNPNRIKHEVPRGWLEREWSHPLYYTEQESVGEIKDVMVGMQKRMAFLRIGATVKILRALTVPDPQVEGSTIEQVKQEYARRLLTPIAEIEREWEQPIMYQAQQQVVYASGVVSSARVSIPSRCAGVSGKQPVATFAGASGSDDELLGILSLYHYLQVSQIARLLQREKSINAIRARLKKLVEESGLAETVTLPRVNPSGGGKNPFLYTLSIAGMKYLNNTHNAGLPIPTGTRKHGRLEHTSAVNDLLIAAALLPLLDPSVSIVDFRHERGALKTTPVKIGSDLLVPDGFVQVRYNNQEYGYFLELDRNTEDQVVIAKKAQLYVAGSQGILQKHVSCNGFRVVFCVVEGGDIRVKKITQMIESALQQQPEYAEMFLVGKIPETITPVELFTTPSFAVPFDGLLHALLEA